ncbi:Uncharacterised protein [Mycobacteroides abscessus subsp. abscessus]|nr:Uncharacterised protein [Mycobacteroides abscessus subsp. abscessus]
MLFTIGLILKTPARRQIVNRVIAEGSLILLVILVFKLVDFDDPFGRRLAVIWQLRFKATFL